ncbi:hypothetical protein ATCC90586_005187 [Pythium insidiosum]|nr:hypothetical protein ATCC90586_005187 [Pythium insidiosum]
MTMWLRELARLDWCREAFPVLVNTIAQHLIELDHLSEEMLADDSPQVSQAMETLLFARLAPHLVLRVIPQELFLIFADTRGLQELITELWRETVDPLEFKEIKMLSVELLAKCSSHSIHMTVLAQLEVFLEDHVLTDAPQIPRRRPNETLRIVTPCGFVTAKLMVYYLNRVFAVMHTKQADDDVVAHSCETLLHVLRIPCIDDSVAFSPQRSPLMDLQLGAIECLALLLVQELTSSSTVRPVTDRVLELLGHRDEEIQLRVCCCNILLRLLQGQRDNEALESPTRQFAQSLLEALSN